MIIILMRFNRLMPFSGSLATIADLLSLCSLAPRLLQKDPLTLQVLVLPVSIAAVDQVVQLAVEPFLEEMVQNLLMGFWGQVWGDKFFYHQ
jgi:hypothetical protein